MKEILLNIESKEMRYAHRENGVVENIIIERKQERQITGNIYRGRVKAVLDSIQSAFIEIEGETGFIHISDIVENTKKFEELFEMDFYLPPPTARIGEKVEIKQVMKIDQPVLVQVVKEAIGSKGPRLTSNISIAGRYLVLLPNSSHRGVSRKIENPLVRDRLKALIRAFEMPKDMGLICRTASASATSEMLIEEAHDLLQQWQTIIDSFHKSAEPTLLYAESDLIKRAILTAIDKKFDRIVVDDYPIYQACHRLLHRYKGEQHIPRIELYKDKLPIFEYFKVEKEIEKALRNKFWLPSGGYLFFECTEAMYTIDVNSGRSTKNKTDVVEEFLVQINLEAAEHIARQLRLRNIGGIIVCDFIDMEQPRNRERVFKHLQKCLKEDSAKCTILEISDLGLVQMTRQRTNKSLLHIMFTHCPYCSGKGKIKSYETITIEIERALKKAIDYAQQFSLKLVTHPEIDRYLGIIDKQHLLEIAEKRGAKLCFETKDTLHLNDFRFYSMATNKLVEV